MSEITRVLSQIETGDPSTAAQLLPLVYDELRKLAAAKLAREKPGQTLQATGLVHEAYLRLVDQDEAQRWNSRGHFFAAAAEAMRRILIESARRKMQLRRGGDRQRVDLLEGDLAVCESPDELLALDEALAMLAIEDPAAAELVKLHVFTGVPVEQAGQMLGFARATAYRHWSYARAWLRCAIQGDPRKT